MWKKIEYPMPLNYEISEDGRARHATTKREVCLSTNLYGYKYFNAWDSTTKKQRTVYIHSSVIRHFHPYNEAYGGNSGGANRVVVDHIDGNKTNNHYLNLQYLTSKDNSLKAGARGETNSRAVLTETQAREIKYSMPQLSHSAVASMYNVSKSTVAYIRQGKRWAHI